MPDYSNTYTSLSANNIVWGVEQFTGFVVEASNEACAPAINYEAFNESGQRIFQRLDDKTYTRSVDALVNTSTIPVAGTVMTFAGQKYVLESVDIKKAQKEVAKITFNLKRSEYLTLP